MNQVNVSFAKIVATPTPAAWSQAYNAGNLFLVVSLESTDESAETDLTATGKKIINNLEAEFFGLETKNLESIKKAVITGLDPLPENAVVSLALGYIKDQVLYVLLYGAGSIFIKRDDKIGAILERKEEDSDMLSASGYVKQSDLVVLATKQFAQVIPEYELKKSLELALPSDIAETLTPHVHNAENGGPAAIILSITGIPQAEKQTAGSPAQMAAQITTDAEKYNEEEFPEEQEEKEPVTKKQFSLAPLKNRLSRLIPKYKMHSYKKNARIIPLLIIVAILVILLTAGIISTINARNEQQLQKRYAAIYSDAKNKYDTAMSIRSITPEKTAEYLEQANAIIESHLAEFPDKSEQRQKLLVLQQQIKDQTSHPVLGKTVTAKAAEAKDSPLLKALAENTDTVSGAEDKDFIYLLSDNGISSISKTTGKKKELVKNNNDWKNPVALGTYLGNLYVLDSKIGVIKYLVTQNGYGKADYFKDGKPDLTKAVSMAIDGSVWILFSDGSIAKYTKGVKDNFTVKGLDTVKKAKQIAASASLAHLYVLDTGNNRIIELQKDGAYLKSYNALILGQAEAFTVTDDEKSAYVLSGKKFWQLPLE